MFLLHCALGHVHSAVQWNVAMTYDIHAPQINFMSRIMNHNIDIALLILGDDDDNDDAPQSPQSRA